MNEVLKLCECGCGKQLRKSTHRFVRGHNGAHRTHGMRKSPEYKTWAGMLRRCYNPNEERYPRYGGRGIGVCDRWRHSFENFYADMGPKPTPDYSIERMDNNKGYEPSNCCWEHKKLQARNRRTSRMVNIDGRVQCLAAWSEESGVPYSTIQRRLNRGWLAKDAVFTPVQKIKRA